MERAPIRNVEYRDAETNELLTQDQLTQRANERGFSGAVSLDQIGAKAVRVK